MCGFHLSPRKTVGILFKISAGLSLLLLLATLWLWNRSYQNVKHDNVRTIRDPIAFQDNILHLIIDRGTFEIFRLRIFCSSRDAWLEYLKYDAIASPQAARSHFLPPIFYPGQGTRKSYGALLIAKGNPIRNAVHLAGVSVSFTEVAWPACYQAVIFSALPFVVLCEMSYRIYRRTRLRRTGLCQKCGYDLRATPDHCPECGHQIEEKTT